MEWYYSVGGGEQSGPVSTDALKQLKAGGAITDDTLVWRDGMGQWQAYNLAFTAPSIPVVKAGTVKCAVCGKMFSQEDTISYQGSSICATCKPVFFQRLKEGVSLGIGTVSRKKKLIVMGCNSKLPDRCVKCNATTTKRLGRKLYWHSPWLYSLVLVGILIYAVVAIAVRKKAEIGVGLCDEHRQERTRNIYIAWGLVIGSILCIVLAIALDTAWPAWLSPVLFFAGIIYGIKKASIVTAAFIDKDFIHLRGAGKDFLESLPEWKD